MTNEIIELLRENNKLLKEIKSLLLMQMCDTDYIAQQDNKALNINIIANIISEMLEDNTEFKNMIINYFKI